MRCAKTVSSVPLRQRYIRPLWMQNCSREGRGLLWVHRAGKVHVHPFYFVSGEVLDSVAKCGLAVGVRDSWSEGPGFNPVSRTLCPWASHFIPTCLSPPRSICWHKLGSVTCDGLAVPSEWSINISQSFQVEETWDKCRALLLKKIVFLYATLRLDSFSVHHEVTKWETQLRFGHCVAFRGWGNYGVQGRFAGGKFSAQLKWTSTSNCLSDVGIIMI